MGQRICRSVPGDQPGKHRCFSAFPKRRSAASFSLQATPLVAFLTAFDSSNAFLFELFFFSFSFFSCFVSLRFAFFFFFLSLALRRYFPYKHHRRSVPVSADLHSRFLWSAGESYAAPCHGASFALYISSSHHPPCLLLLVVFPSSARSKSLVEHEANKWVADYLLA